MLPESPTARRDRRRREIEAAGRRIQTEIERQDAAGYRDWDQIVEEALRNLPTFVMF